MGQSEELQTSSQQGDKIWPQMKYRSQLTTAIPTSNSIPCTTRGTLLPFRHCHCHLHSYLGSKKESQQQRGAESYVEMHLCLARRAANPASRLTVSLPLACTTTVNGSSQAASTTVSTCSASLVRHPQIAIYQAKVVNQPHFSSGDIHHALVPRVSFAGDPILSYGSTKEYVQLWHIRGFHSSTPPNPIPAEPTWHDDKVLL